VGMKLRKAGLRCTQQRIELGRLLFAKGDRHFTADLLHDEAKHNRIPVSLATIYNTLQLFTNVDLCAAWPPVVRRPGSTATCWSIITSSSRTRTASSTYLPAICPYSNGRRSWKIPKSIASTSSCN